MNSLQENLLETYSPKDVFTCEHYTEKGIHFAEKIVLNIFYNKRKFSSEEVRKNIVECLKKRAKVKRKFI